MSLKEKFIPFVTMICYMPCSVLLFCCASVSPQVLRGSWLLRAVVLTYPVRFAELQEIVFSGCQLPDYFSSTSQIDYATVCAATIKHIVPHSVFCNHQTCCVTVLNKIKLFELNKFCNISAGEPPLVYMNWVAIHKPVQVPHHIHLGRQIFLGPS